MERTLLKRVFLLRFYIAAADCNRVQLIAPMRRQLLSVVPPGQFEIAHQRRLCAPVTGEARLYAVQRGLAAGGIGGALAHELRKRVSLLYVKTEFEPLPTYPSDVEIGNVPHGADGERCIKPRPLGVRCSGEPREARFPSRAVVIPGVEALASAFCSAPITIRACGVAWLFRIQAGVQPLRS